MRDVSRLAEPAPLKRNSSRWQKELLDALASNDKKRISNAKRKYNHPKVREQLMMMYGNRCCYCEVDVGPPRADQIEHREPVNRNPARAFDWDNLHLACGGCNQAKSNKWDLHAPILDAAADSDKPITQHLSYTCSDTGVRRVFSTPRGEVTIDHADLNREALRHKRGSVLLGVLGVIKEIKERQANYRRDTKATNRLAELKDKCLGDYGSMIEWTIREFL